VQEKLVEEGDLECEGEAEHPFYQREFAVETGNLHVEPVIGCVDLRAETMF
jgi:hypothetical protein